MSKDGLLTRRRAIATIGAASTLLLPGRRHLAADTRLSDIASGTVFEDRNGDARRAKGARGIPGVMVSNGVDVTLTDSEGRWSIPVQSGDHIFVITPSHWTTAGRGPSSFSYLHQPDGTPVAAKLCSPAIAPTGALPESIDFPLLRQPQSKPIIPIVVLSRCCSRHHRGSTPAGASAFPARPGARSARSALRPADGAGRPTSRAPPRGGPASPAASAACRTPSCPSRARSRPSPGRP